MSEITEAELWEELDRLHFEYRARQPNEVTMAEWAERYRLEGGHLAERELTALVKAGKMTMRKACLNGHACNVYAPVTKC